MLQKLPAHENEILNALRRYVEHVLQAPLEIGAPVTAAQIPSFLNQHYTHIYGHILNRECILMLASADFGDTPATIAKHRDLLQRHFPSSIIVLAIGRLTNHNRHRLIAHHVPFIVPGNQLFVPELALDLREHFRSEPEVQSETMTPTGQLLVIAELLGRIEQDTPSGFATHFHYSAMSMGRAIAELEAFGLIEVETAGRYRRTHFHLPRNELWLKARPLLRSPVRKRRRIRRPHDDMVLPLAGESALAALTNLSHPRLETRAVAASDWKSLVKRYDLDRPLNWDEPEIELETWAYDPTILGDAATVDPISLWFSIPDNADERMGEAKEALLKKVGL
jgi:hypothetical protein